jgi:hypothetical protein
LDLRSWHSRIVNLSACQHRFKGRERFFVKKFSWPILWRQSSP